MPQQSLRRLILNDALPHGLFAVRGESPAFWVLDWRGNAYGQSRAMRIRGRHGSVGMDDNRWLWVARMGT